MKDSILKNSIIKNKNYGVNEIKLFEILVFLVFTNKFEFEKWSVIVCWNLIYELRFTKKYYELIKLKTFLSDKLKSKLKIFHLT
jgi:hypothetical protein